MDALLLDAPVGGWAGGWGTLSEVVASPSTQSPLKPKAGGEEGDVGDSPQAATHLLRLSEGFVAGDSPKVSPAPHVDKANRKAMRAKMTPLAETSPAQLNRRLKLGTVSRSELERARKQCDHRDDKAETCPPNANHQGAVENVAGHGEQETPEKHLRMQGKETHEMLEQLHSPKPEPSAHMIEYNASQRPGTAGSVKEFSIPIDSTPWAIDSAELQNGPSGQEEPSGSLQRLRGTTAPRTPTATLAAVQFKLDGCTPPENGASPSVLASPDSASKEASSAKKPRQRVASASRTSVLSRPASRSSSLQSPAALASAAVESALGRLEVQRPNSREAVAVAREVRSEMNRWLRNVDPKVPHQQLQARARSRGPAVQSLDCGSLSSAPKQAAGWVPYEQRTDGAGVDQSRRSLTPSTYPSLSAARARQREQSAEAFGAALGPTRRTTRSAQSDARHSVSLPDIGGLRRDPVSQAAAEFQRKASRAISVHDRPQWGRAQYQQPKKVPGRLRRAAAPWAGLSAVPTVGAVMSAMR